MMPGTMGTSHEGAVPRLPLIVVETGTPTRWFLLRTCIRLFSRATLLTLDVETATARVSWNLVVAGRSWIHSR